jgi:hypothetical protein
MRNRPCPNNTVQGSGAQAVMNYGGAGRGNVWRMWTQSHSNGVRSFGLARRRYQNSEPAPYYAALLATPDRSDADRQADNAAIG